MKDNYKQFQEVLDRLTAYIRVRDNEPKSGEDELWKRIGEKIERKEKFYRKPQFYILSAVAASLFLFILLSDKLYRREGTGDFNKYVELLKDIPSDDSQIQIYLSPQKKVTVEEQTASVTYSSEGQVSINEQMQEEEAGEETEEEIEYNRVVVPKGKYTHLTLSDGSTVHINSGTRVVYPRVFSPGKREIYVDGEVCLDVVKDERAPFIVKTSFFDVKVLGTTFNVNAYKDDSQAEVVLVTGSVQLSDQHKNKIELKPDELVTINGGKVGAVQNVDALDYVAWTDGLLILHSDSLSKVFKKLERYYGVTIAVSPEAGMLKMKGKIDLKQSLDDLLKLISATAPISYSGEDGMYSVLKKREK